ncbi:DUF2971 domain-containing protein [Roseovarius mucosus]|uniref:DUF2971 domain-containing protein n=1 Tax=Roseovarius mucosus TaxID=215743 RepID=UPI0035CF00CD|tara:strand:+ start:224 stop:874 length:651 start_codon:yes stop_codon:yes gene_type:complete
MRVYKFYNPKYAIDNLKKRRLKISTRNSLNDPFEFNAFSFRERKERLVWASTLDGLFRNKGVICFCGSWSNPVIWSHYAENHTGLALGFDVPNSLLLKVTYADRRLDFSKEWGSSKSDNERLMRKALSTKFKHWEYENEYRLSAALDEPDPDSGHYFLPFSKELILRKIVIGAKSSLTTLDIRNAYGTREDIEIVTGRLAFKSFSIVKQRSEAHQR